MAAPLMFYDQFKGRDEDYKWVMLSFFIFQISRYHSTNSCSKGLDVELQPEPQYLSEGGGTM
jgi:hypothetical protein